MSNQEALRDLIQRFAISVLSRERKNEALNEELLVGKYTGEFYVKTKDGVVMSTDIMNRIKSSTDEAIRVAELMGMIDELYKVEFESLPLPCHIDYGTNIIQNEPISLPVNVKEVLFYIDVDEYDIVNGEPEMVYSEGEVKIIIEIIENGKTRYMRINKNLSNINFSIIPLELNGNVTSIKINNITIENSGNQNRALLLHNVYVTVNK